MEYAVKVALFSFPISSSVNNRVPTVRFCHRLHDFSLYCDHLQIEITITATIQKTLQTVFRCQMHNSFLDLINRFGNFI